MCSRANEVEMEGREGKGTFTYDVRTERGGWHNSKQEYGLVARRGGVECPEHFADVICEWPRRRGREAEEIKERARGRD